MGVKVIEWKGAYWLDVSHKGRRKRKRIGHGASAKKAAEIAKTKIEARLALGESSVLDDDKPVATFEPAARRWFATYCQLGQLRISTQALYLSNLERYVFPRFGSKPVNEIT